MERHIVVVDVETTGFDPVRQAVVEVAWWNLNTDERGEFVPIHDVHEVLQHADIKALQINRYVDRLADAKQDTDYVELNRLHDALRGNTLAGSNPRFDAAFLAPMFTAANRSNPTPWHHRLWDLSPYAAGVLGLAELPGLATVCERLGVALPDHSAAADVTATGECLTRLLLKAGTPL